MAKGRPRAAGKDGPWRHVNRLQLSALLGVHVDTVTQYARDGMPGLDGGGYGIESVYDAVDCLDWWRERQGRNAKEKAQTRAYDAQAQLNELKLSKQRGDLLSREEVVQQGQSFVKGWAAKIRSLPRRAVQLGMVPRDAEAGLVALCRDILIEISGWSTAADATRAAKEDQAA